MKFTYLFLNILTVLIPLLRSFEPKIFFRGKWRFYWRANFITACFFITWDYLKTTYGVWNFNDNYTLGLRLFGLPIEEILFFATVPYACTFIYETVSFVLKNKYFSVVAANLLLGVSLVAVAASVFFFNKAYTFSVLLIGGLVYPVAYLMFTPDQRNKFLISYLVSLLPMLIVNGFLTALPVVIYNNTQNIGLRLVTIPVEDFIYCFILLAMNIGLYEFFKGGKHSFQITHRFFLQH